jgi:hypothetical protein
VAVSSENDSSVRRSPRRVWTVTIGVVIVIYLLSILAFAQSGRTNSESAAVDVDDGVNISIGLIGITTGKSEMTLRTIGLPSGEYYDQESNTWAKSVRITTPLGVRSLARDIPAGSPIGGTEDITFLIDGDPLVYPFDSYYFGLASDGDQDLGIDPITAPAPLIEIQQIGADGSLGDPVPIGFDDPDGLQGWSERWVLESGSPGTLSAYLSVKRSGGVLAFVLVVLALMLLVACLASVVARSVALKRRPIEATMAGWFAALLFALIPLRTNLPDAPPIGAWMDVLVFYWVEIALMLSMSVFIVSWLRFRKPPPEVERQ